MAAPAQQSEVEAEQANPVLDHQLYAAWAEENHRALTAYARALVSDGEQARELAQEALLSAWQFRERYSGTAEQLGPWVRGILRNHWHDWYKNRKLTLLKNDKLKQLEAAHRHWDAAADAGRGELLERLSRCLDRLPEPMREAIDGTYAKGWSGRELAQRLGSSESTLRKRLQRAREQLRSCLDSLAPNA